MPFKSCRRQLSLSRLAAVVFPFSSEQFPKLVIVHVAIQSIVCARLESCSPSTPWITDCAVIHVHYT